MKDAVTEQCAPTPISSPVIDVVAMDKNEAVGMIRARSQKRADELIQWLRSYAEERINSRLMDERRCITPHILLDFGNHGLMGLEVPLEHGGLALRTGDFLRVLEQLSAIDLTLALFVGNHNTLGIRPIQYYAASATRDTLLPTLASGRELAAFALTERCAGSNPKAMASVGVPDRAGGWRLRGTKIWSGSAAWAGAICTFVKLMRENGRPAGVTGFVVRQGTPGLRQGPEAMTMGMRGMVQNEVRLKDVAVDETNLLGQPGQGFLVAQDAMLHARLAIGAACVGAMKRSIQLMHRYAARRPIATGLLLDNPVTRARLESLVLASTAVETLVYRIAALIDAGHSIPPEVYAACKTTGPEYLWQAADALVQTLGGRGYMEPNAAPQLVRDARVLRIFEGPTETMHTFIGSTLIHNDGALHTFIAEALGAPAVADALRADAAEIMASCRRTAGLRSHDRDQALYWACFCAGQIGSAGILLAALQGAAAVSPCDPHLKAAISWARGEYEATRERVLLVPPTASPFAADDGIAELLARFKGAIGEVEQRLPGVEDAVDPLLLVHGPVEDVGENQRISHE